MGEGAPRIGALPELDERNRAVGFLEVSSLFSTRADEIFAAYWPYQDQDAPHGHIAKLFEDIRKYAVSRSSAVPTCAALLFTAQEQVFGRELWGLPHSLAPGTVDQLRVAKVSPFVGDLELSWNGLDQVVGTPTRYDVVRGLLSTLRASGYPGAATCVSDDGSDTPYSESGSSCPALPDDGCWYLVRGQNGCGTGSYGAAAFDAAGPCP